MDKETRYSAGERVTWRGMAVNAVLAIVKFAAGVAGRSEALIADAAHSLSDLFTDFVVLVSLTISKRPVDEFRPYGYGRVETLGTGILGVFLMAVAGGILWNAAATMKGGVDYIPTPIALAGALVSIVAKEWLYRYTVKVGRKIHSQSIVANAWHHRSDALSSVASLVGAGAAMMGWPLFDPIAAVLVTILIFKVGWDISVESFRDIIDTAVKKEVRDKIVEAAMGTPGVIDYHDLKTRRLGSEVLVDIHIEVNPWLNVSEAHAIADKVKAAILRSVPNVADVLVHIDPEGEQDGLVYSTPKDQIMTDVVEAARSVSGVMDCRNIMLHYVGDDIIVNLTIDLSPRLTIKEGYEKITEVKEKITEIDKVADAVVSVDLYRESADEK